MKAIHYAGDVLLTGDVIADAVVDYAAALARRETSATIDIPVRFPSGRISSVNFLLGPASQLVAVPTESDYDEVVDDGLVAELILQTRRLQNPQPRPDDTDTTNDTVLEDLEYPSE